MRVAGVPGSLRYLQDLSPALHPPPRPSTFRPLVSLHMWLRFPHAQPKQSQTERVVQTLPELLDAPPLPELLLPEQVLQQPEPVAHRAGQ